MSWQGHLKSKWVSNMNGLLILKLWLKIDYFQVANKLGFINSTTLPSDALIARTIRFLDSETSKENRGENPNVNLIISTIALLWEHTDREKYQLTDFVLKMLSRIGYPSSAIITDKGYNAETGSFSAPDSFFDYLTLPLLQQKNEICIKRESFLLTDFQCELWRKMERSKHVGVSAPTSAGKSFVILLYTVKRVLQDNWNVIYIVPTLSLVNQVCEDYTNMFHKLGFTDFIVTSGLSSQDPNKGNVYVWTQEKAIAVLSTPGANIAPKKTILVVDEIQNIERISQEEDERAKILYDAIQEFRHIRNIEKVIISGPRINEVSSLGEELFGEKSANATTNICPVLSITYSVKQEEQRFFFKQYCALIDSPYEKEIENPQVIAELGNTNISAEYIRYLSSFVDAFVETQNIIFAPTSDKAREIANNLNENRPAICNPEVSDLVDYYKSTVSEDYTLCKTLQNGVAYHHGKMPMHVRRTLEKAIQQKMVSNVVCTTTLIQGVNLPAQNIIIRNPHLYTRRRKGVAELTSYEMANLRGRAGRLLKDFVGRTFVLDEGEFAKTEGYEGEILFDEVRKDLSASYGEKYKQYKEEILSIVSSERTIDSSMQPYGHLATYIRQSVLKYGEASTSRMSEVGVDLTPSQVAAIKLKLENLHVPREICTRNRYWDPFVLDIIYTDFSGRVPSFPAERGAQTRLNEITTFLRDTPGTSNMYSRYIPAQYRRGPNRSLMCRLGIKWACETSLSELLQSSGNSEKDKQDQIENTIQLLQDTISYSLPLLLKPLVEMKNPNSVIIPCLQAGACSAYTRKMIEIGIPRELAISLNHRLFCKAKAAGKEDVQLEDEIRTTIKENSGALSFWEKVQLEFML